MRIRINWDALGIAASVACAIHCAFLPLLLTSLPLFGANIIDHQMFEYSMIALSFVIGILALWHGFRKHHHSAKPILLFSVGIGLLVFKQLFHDWQYWILPFAVIAIVWAHLLNYKSCRVHDHAHADDCNH